MKMLVYLLAFLAGTAYADLGETIKFAVDVMERTVQPYLPEFPNLAGQYTEYLFHELELYKAHLRESQAMSAVMDTVPSDQLLPLAKFYSEQVPIAKLPNTTPEMIRKGRALYFNDINALGLACADCHGTNGEGTPATNTIRAFPRVAGQQLDFLFSALLQYNQGKKNTLLGMRSAMRGLSDSDFAALAAYMSAMSP